MIGVIFFGLRVNDWYGVGFRIRALGQVLTFSASTYPPSERLLHFGSCRTSNSTYSANPDLDPTEDTGGLVPVTSLLVGDQDKRLLSEAANASTRPADLIEIVKRAPIGR